MFLDSVVIVALAGAACYSLADLSSRAGVQRTNIFAGSTISLVSMLLFFFLLTPFAGISFPPFGKHYFWVAAGGAANPGLFIIFFLTGIFKIGVARAAPIKGTSPLFAVILAVLFLAERPAWYHIAGVLLIGCGIVLISSGKTEGRWRRIDVLWPAAAAVLSALAAVFWRVGLPSFPNVFAALFVGMGVAAAVVVVYSGFFARALDWEAIRGGWKPFTLCGLALSFGGFFYASALQKGEVSRMLPLIQTSPLFTMAWALLFLRSVESITWRVPAGALLTVGGAALVSLRYQ